MASLGKMLREDVWMALFPYLKFYLALSAFGKCVEFTGLAVRQVKDSGSFVSYVTSTGELCSFLPVLFSPFKWKFLRSGEVLYLKRK